MKKYIHGSEDSLDVDVFYVFDSMPSYQDCHTFCSSDKNENRNIIVIENGMVTDCFKGTCDEIQNSLYNTYSLHDQEYELDINEPIKRDIILKTVRVVRCFLSHFSRADNNKYRTIVKDALKSGDWKKRIDTLLELDMSCEDFQKNNKTEVRKVFAFQLAQILGLYNDIEIYTKSDVGKHIHQLKQYVYRDKLADTRDLKIMFDKFIEIVHSIKYEQIGDFVEFYDFEKVVDIKNEKIIK